MKQDTYTRAQMRTHRGREKETEREKFKIYKSHKPERTRTSAETTFQESNLNPREYQITNQGAEDYLTLPTQESRDPIKLFF